MFVERCVCFSRTFSSRPRGVPSQGTEASRSRSITRIKEAIGGAETDLFRLHEKGRPISLSRKFPTFRKFSIFDGTGAVCATAGFVVERTASKPDEEALDPRAARERVLLAAVPAVLWTTDADLNITSNLGAGLSTIGLRTGELVGRALADVVDLGGDIFAAHARALAGEAGGYRFVFKDRALSARVEPLREEGRIVGVIGAALDVTEQVRIEQELREGEERYRRLFEGSPLPGWVVDVDSLRFQAVNEAAVALYGYSREDFAHMFADTVRAPDERSGFAGYMRSLRDDAHYSGRSVHQTKSGDPVEVDAYHHVVTLAGRRSVISLMHEVAERERLLQERDQYRLQLRQLMHRLVNLQEEERRALAADLHDRVGQCLSALGIKLTMAQSSAPPGAEKLTRLLRESQEFFLEAVHSVRAVISELRPAALDDYGLAAALRVLGQQAQRRYGFEVEHVALGEQRHPAAVEAAAFRVAQEALANAAKHAQAGRVKLTIRARPGAIALCISDDGVGFEVATQRSVGRPSRWGLLMMRERAEAVRARLRICSRVGGGTRVFMFWREQRAVARPPG